MAYRKPLFLSGLALALGPTLLRYYLTMPMVGSQSIDSIRWVYHLDRVTWVAQIVGAVLAAIGLASIVMNRKSPGEGGNGTRSRKTLIGVSVVSLVAIGLYLASIKMAAPAMFQPFKTVAFATGTSDALPPETLVMGITSGSVAKAYPIRLLAYHHRLDDTLDGEPIWVTYCTMCRTGKIFSPMVDGRRLAFDLVGAVRYNSFYRDRETGTLWFQANGRAAVGPLEGSVLTELRADQMTLERWLEMYPDSEVLQPDPAAASGYTMFDFDLIDGVRSKPGRRPGWQWVVGVVHDGQARGYLWSMLANRRLIQDRVGELPLAVQLHSDGISQRVWDRRLEGRVLDLELDRDNDLLIDAATGSTFGFDGVATSGELAGQSLELVPATVEYRHAFEYFSDAEIYEGEAATS